MLPSCFLRIVWQAQYWVHCELMQTQIACILRESSNWTIFSGSSLSFELSLLSWLMVLFVTESLVLLNCTTLTRATQFCGILGQICQVTALQLETTFVVAILGYLQVNDRVLRSVDASLTLNRLSTPRFGRPWSSRQGRATFRS